MEHSDEKLRLWLEGELEIGEVSELAKTTDLDGLKSFLTAVESLEPDLHFDVQGGYQQLERRIGSTSSQRRITPFIYRVAAGIAILLGVFWFFSDDQHTTIITGTEVVATKPLPDGSTVMLNDGSMVEFSPARFKDHRYLSLSGQAYFEVENGTDFVVETGMGDVEVLGTKFSVSADSLLTVLCFEGSVRVVREDGRSHVLSKDEGVIFSAEEASEVHMHEEAPHWIADTFEFRDVHIGDLCIRLSQHFGIVLEVSDQIDKSFTGYVSATKLEEALESITKALNMQVEHVSEKVIRIIE